ncbi:retrovirus-related pol polyprotein from transposon TNT 1-94 [Tanacetum coccineum]
MILESVKHGPLDWLSIEEDGVTRLKKYAELSASEKLQADLRDLHTTNFHQLKAYLEQHEIHVNEVRIMRERNQDPLALSPQYGSIHSTQHYSTTYPSTPLATTYPTTLYLNAYSSTVHQEACPQSQSVPQIEYIVSTVNQQTHLAEFPQIDSGLVVPVFKQGDGPIDAINKMMSFLSTVVTSRGNNSGLQRVVKCFNCQGEGHMARQCLNLKRKRDATWFRDKVLLVEAQGSGKVLNEEELEFLADPVVAEAKAVLMANLSSYGPDVLSEVPHSENTHNDMLNQSVQEMSYSEQARLVNYPENEITSDSNIIPYSQYLLETQTAAIQDTNSSAQQDAMILFVFEQLSNQVTNYNKVNKDNLIANESLSAELERYKERKNAKFADFEKEINYLKQTLSEQSKEKELLTKTFNVFKNESKEKEAKNIDTEIALEKKVKELGNIERIFKKRTKRKPKASNSKHGVEKGKVKSQQSKKIQLEGPKLPKPQVVLQKRKTRVKIAKKVQTNMALMAFLDSEVYNDKTCSKTCLKNYETLKKQCDDLIVKLNQTEFTAATYKRGLATIEEQLYPYRKNSRSQDLDKSIWSQITDKSKKGLGYNVVPPPHPFIYNRPKRLDLSYSGLDEFKDPEFKSYGSEESKQESNIGKPQQDDTGFVDSGCSRHMTGNIAYLSDFKEFDGGYVTFGGGAHGGKISGKETLKIDSLDFKDATSDESMLWHKRLGHINFKNINNLVKDILVRGLPTKRFENDQTCVACLKGKQHIASCKSKVLNLITKLLFKLHMDLFGPTFVSSLMHKKYCLVVTNDYNRFTWVFFLITKDKTSEILNNFFKEIENLVDKKVKIIRCDNGTEFKNIVIDDFCREKAIRREYSIARTPRQNGVAERRNITLIEAVRTMLADFKLPTTF